MNDKPIDHEYTNEIVCPYCGYVDRDFWEMGDGEECDSETDCKRCDKTFLYSRHISVKYSTQKKDLP